MLFFKNTSNDLPEQDKRVIIFTAPSGAGKTTLVRHLLKNLPNNISFSVSATTRTKRAIETEGLDYYFLDHQTFQQKIDDQAFIEWEEVYEGCRYGTLKSEVDRIWTMGKQVIFDVDVKGATNIKKHYGDKALAVFVKPPSLDTLVERLTNRQTETPESLQKRIARATMEMGYENNFDCTIVNDDLDTAKREALQIVQDFLELSLVEK